MTYTEAVDYLKGQSRAFCKPGLDRVEALLAAVGNPERTLRAVHIAGTNGKGSCASMLSSVLTAAGYKTGTYTSPAIKYFNERIRINGEMISEQTLASLTERVRVAAEGMEDKPTEFELLTAIAFLFFCESGCDVAVVEAGLGGRLDATNVIPHPTLSVITGVSLDHTSYLGDTVEMIATEKAGIIKDAPVLFGGTDAVAERVVRERAAECGVEYIRPVYTSLSLIRSDLRGTLFSYKGYERLKINLFGLYQIRNAATVIEAAEALSRRGLDVPESAIRSGLESAVWQGRFEVISHNPTVIFDGAHNAEGIRSSCDSIAHYLRQKPVVLTGVLADKEYRIIAENIARVASYAYTITPDSPRALAAADYAAVLSECGIGAQACASVESALRLALTRAEQEGCAVVILGSLYTYGEVTDALDRLGYTKRR